MKSISYVKSNLTSRLLQQFESIQKRFMSSLWDMKY